MSQETAERTQEVISAAHSAGATLVGVADLNALKDMPTFGGLVLNDFRFALSIAMAIPDRIIECITAQDPGNLYAWAYRTANTALDIIALKLSSKISGMGYNALPIPASMRLDREKEVGHASHKAFALAAGLGWIGRNGLLINSVYGARLRLATVLTDMEMISGKPLNNMCGECRSCIQFCPSKALKYNRFEVRPESRDIMFDIKKCSERVNAMNEMISKKPGMSGYAATICGVCIKVCPFSKSIKEIKT